MKPINKIIASLETRLLLVCLFLFFSCQEKPDLPQVSNRIEFSGTDIAMEADRTLVETSVTYEITPVVLHYGHCWSTAPNPSTGDHKTEYQGNLTGSTIKSTLSALQPGQEYHVRAYIQTRHEIIYSSDQVFTTLALLPTINTIPASNITTTSAQSGGNITSEGSSLVTARGVCFGTSPNPDLAGNHTIDGSGGGAFTSNLTGLSENTLYYVRAYATSGLGTTFGEEISFMTVALLPTVTTNPTTSITTTSAQSGGNVTSQGSMAVTARGVCWGTNPNPSLSGNHTTDGSGVGAFTSNLTGLSASMLYYVRAYATSAVGTAYGNHISFTTSFFCGGTVNHGGQTYNTVAIDTQCWFKENLNIGTIITGTSNQTNNGTIEKYCYNDDANNCAIYGGLYKWDEMMNYSTTPGTQGICPIGWHIPTDAEWCTLTTYLDATVNCNSFAFSGTDAGGKMKETGYDHWNSPNTGATNSSGFTALGAGLRTDNGYFYNLRYFTYFWSSSEYSSTSGIGWVLGYDGANVFRYCSYGTYGFSVRCLRNN